MGGLHREVPRILWKTEQTMTYSIVFLIAYKEMKSIITITLRVH